MSSFDIESFVSSDVVSRHPCINSNTRARILSYVNERLQSGIKFDRTNPLTIADIGCGDGKFTKRLVSKDLPKIITNITKYLIDPYGDNSIDIHRLTDIDFQSKFASNHCDIIICKGCVHLFTNFYDFLQNVERILKPNGFCIIISMSDEILFPWGKYAQKSFDISTKSDSFKWIGYDEMNQNQFEQTSQVLISQCQVKHERLKENVKLTKQEWSMFIKGQSWSTLQSLTSKQINNCLEVVDEKYPNSEDTVNIDLKWIVSTIRKRGGGDISSKL